MGHDWTLLGTLVTPAPARFVVGIMGMLKFGTFNGKFDTRINGLGLDLFVSEVQNTSLKEPKVSRNIPTVAKVTQGEVIIFAADAIRKMVGVKFTL